MGVIGIPNIEIIGINSGSEWSDRTLQLRHWHIPASDHYSVADRCRLTICVSNWHGCVTPVVLKASHSSIRSSNVGIAGNVFANSIWYRNTVHTHNLIAKTRIVWSFSEYFLCPYVNQQESHLARAETVRVSCYRFDTCDIGINFIGDPEMVFPLCHQGIPLGCGMTTLLGTSIRSSVASLSGWSIC